MLPRILKALNLHEDGASYLGQVTEVTLPKFVRKMEEYQAGGMPMPIKADYGLEALTLEWMAGGLMLETIGNFGAQRFDEVRLRFNGSYQREDTGQISAFEMTISGRHSTVDPGSAKKGSATEFKVVTEIGFIEITVDGEEYCHIDVLNMIERWHGVDRLEGHRIALGL